MPDRPELIHSYRHHHLDSSRWQAYRPRDSDIIVSTSYKSGTTWMQAILLNLVFQGQPVPEIHEASPWLGMRLRPLNEVIDGLEAQEQRRVIKSHLPLDGLPFYEQVRYVVVARDARDVFMSLWNHYRNYTDRFVTELNTDRIGDPFPPPPDDIHAFWREWITRGWFEWESEGYPFWSNLHHTRTWWAYRDLPNILLVHYNDLQLDLPGEIRRVADFVGIEVTHASLANIVEAVSFASMKAKAVASDAEARSEQGLAPGEDFSDSHFRGGETAFIYKGTNGRWRGVLSDEELGLYREAMDRVLDPASARWLESGRLALQAR